jgi:hypothetical protein
MPAMAFNMDISFLKNYSSFETEIQNNAMNFFLVFACVGTLKAEILMKVIVGTVYKYYAPFAFMYLAGTPKTTVALSVYSF